MQVGREVDVRVELDTAPRETPLADDLAAALDEEATASFCAPARTAGAPGTQGVSPAVLRR